VRVTFDRRVESAPQHHDALVARSPNPHSVFGDIVVLELKFTMRFPKLVSRPGGNIRLYAGRRGQVRDRILEKGEDWVMPPHSPDRVLEEFLDAKSYPGLFNTVRV